MGCVAKKRSVIDSMLKDRLSNFAYNERLIRYESEFRPEIIKLLKECYPDTLTDKYLFYDESFKSLIGFYDSDLLLVNLFLEKDVFSITNYLLKSGAFGSIGTKYLTQFSDYFYNFLRIKIDQNSKITEDDVTNFVRGSLESIIDEISDADWSPNNHQNPLVRKFTVWLDLNIDSDDKEIAFLIFTKVWNSRPEFVEFFLSKAIILYDVLTVNLNKRMNDLNVESYIKFIDSIKGIRNRLFNEYNYYPIIDDKESNKYKDGYVSKRRTYLKVYDKALELNQLSVNCNYYDLIKELNEDYPECFITKIQNIITEKVSLFHYPAEEELESIWKLESNYNIVRLRNQLKKNFYLYEYE